MKIIIPSVRDTGGTGWNLAHAINNVSKGKHHAVDFTVQKSYINYPCIANMGDYNVKTCRDMIYKADVVVFLGDFWPFYQAPLKLDPEKMKNKKTLLLFMGSEWRNGRAGILKHTEDLIKGPYKIAVGSPCMLLPAEDKDKTPTPKGVEWLPLTRAFDEIASAYSMPKRDRTALSQFTKRRDKVVFMHAPTSEERKGSQTFYYAVTRAQQMVPNLIFSTVRGQPWINCLKALASSDLLFDQDPPFPETYGGISVEASCFKLPVVSRVNQYAIDFWKKETGLDSPIIQWSSDDDLLKKCYELATDHGLREQFGQETYTFMKALHDEKPVVDRFLKIVDAM